MLLDLFRMFQIGVCIGIVQLDDGLGRFPPLKPRDADRPFPQSQLTTLRPVIQRRKPRPKVGRWFCRVTRRIMG